MPAAATTFELKSWLKTVGLADDVVAEISAKLEPVANNIKGAVMAQSDYSRAMDELRKREQTLEADATAKVQKELDEIKRYRGETDTNYQNAVSERVKAEQALVNVRAQIENLARDYALPNEVMEPILKSVNGQAQAKVEVKPVVAASNDPDPRYMTVDKFAREANAYSRLPIEYMQIAGEYEALFKSNAYIRPDKLTLSPIERILERAGKDKVDLRSAFEREFNVEAKREELRQADVQAQVAKAVEDARRDERSKIAAENPGASIRHTMPKLPGSPALAVAGIPERNADGTLKSAPAGFSRVSASASREDRVAAAVNSFNANLEKALEGQAS